jgi:hypothetical protein
MSIYVQKSLGTGPFRFAAIHRRELSSIDDNPDLSTGPAGEFNRHRNEIFFSADRYEIEKPMARVDRSAGVTPFHTMLFDGTTQGWVFLGMMLFGALLVLIGLTVVIGKGPLGWAEVIFGLLLIVTPVLLTANKRRLIREQERRNREEHAERETRNRELIGAYGDALKQLLASPNDETLNRVRIEREKLDIPYALWRHTGRGTVLQLGFDALSRLGAANGKEIRTLMDHASDVAGLIDDDASGAKRDLYSTVVWHLLADDRLGRVQQQIVAELQGGLGIASEDVPVDTSSIEQFDRLRGVDHRRVPRASVSMQLNPGEYAVHATNGTNDSGATAQIFITNKRFLVDTDKRLEIPLRTIDQIDVDADRELLSVSASNSKKSLVLKMQQPMYTAALLDLAASLDERPRGFT